MKARSGRGVQQRSTRFFTSVLWPSLLVFVGGCLVGRAAPQASGSTPTTPAISSVTPNSIVAGSPSTNITVVGSGFTSDSVIEWNGASLSTSLSNGSLYATVPTSSLSTAGTSTVQVHTSTVVPALSNAVVVQSTTPPAPTLSAVFPNAGPINTAATVTLNGTGFTVGTTVAVNGVIVPSNFVDSGTITATIPAGNLALPGNVNISVTTPASGKGPSPALAYTTYIQMANNDIVYNALDGLLYASVPVSGPGTGGNTVVGIDLATGVIRRTIWVGSAPNKLALSTDGSQLFVGLDGAASVAQVNLSGGLVVNRFHLGGGPGVYNPPYTATALAAIPGEPNSIAVSSTANIAIYDSGVPRAKTFSGSAQGLSFGASSSVLYAASSGQVQELAVDSTGITKTSTLTLSTGANSIQYDSGRLYLSSGQVLDATAGNLLGTFYSSGNTPASGPVVSDSSLGTAFIGTSSFSNSGQVSAFDESKFTLKGSIPVNGIGTQDYPTSFQKIVRWGQDGLALGAALSAFSSVNQIFIFHSDLVKSLKFAPADLSVTLTGPATATTGLATSWVATVRNQGPSEATGATLVMNLDSSLTIGTISYSQGSCVKGGAEFVCDLGNLAKGGSVTVTVHASPRSEGMVAGSAEVSSVSYDPKTSNNSSTTSTTVTGKLYNPRPAISAISPNLVQAGSAEFTLTVTGAGFVADSVVQLGSAALVTTMVSATQLTAMVPAAAIVKYGWAPVTVSNPAPKGGTTQVLPLTIYDLVNVPANAIAFDPYSQTLYADVPSSATNIAGNSVVGINPFTGAVGAPVFVGSQPTVMAETSDGKYIYVGLSGANSLAQFDMEQGKLIATIPLSLPQGGPASVAASWLATMPGSDTTLAVNTPGEGGTFGIFDISGETGSFRPNMSGIYDDDSQTSGAEFYRYDVNTDGLTLIDGTTLYGMGGYSGSIELGSNGLAYGSGGGIVDPTTTPPSQIATLPLFDFYNSGTNGSVAAAAADPSLQKEFLMLQNNAGTSAYGLARYNLNTYVPETVLDMPQSASGISSGWTMLRFGQDGLALLSSGQNYGTGQLDTILMLLRGPL